MKINVAGKARCALLDTGCEHSCIAKKYFKSVRLRQTTEKLFAANGHEISVQGAIEVNFRVGIHETSANLLVSDQLDEMILGSDWLTENKCHWNFGEKTLKIGDEVVTLFSRPSRLVVRRLYVETTTVVPSDTQVQVPVRMAMNSLRTPVGNWVAEPRAVDGCLLTARTLLSGDVGSRVLPVMNLGNGPRKLREGTFLGEAEFVSDGAVMDPNSKMAKGTSAVDCGEPTSRRADNPAAPAELTVSAATKNTVSRWSEPTGRQADDPVRADGEEPTSVPCIGSDRLKLGNEYGHVKCVIDRLPSDLTEKEREVAIKFIHEHANVFSRSEFDIGRTKLIPHHIDTGVNRPVKQQLRRHPQVYLKFIDKQVQKMLDNDIIEESASPWSSNVVLVAKKDGKLRFCIDYRKVNSLTYKDSYPIPKIDACLDVLSGSRFYSTLDLRSGYWQAEIAEVDRDKTAFVTRMGQFRFKVLPFGLANAVSLFQRLQDRILAGLNWFICLVYLDDIAVFSANYQEHLERLRQVVDRVTAAGLKFNPDKCSLFQRKISFLGYTVSARGVEPDEGKIKTILTWPTPQNVTELRAWLGLIGYYRRWIHQMGSKARPLFDLLKKRQPFEWGVPQEESFQLLKQCLTSPPVLALPMDEGKYVLDTDCSDFATGAVLQQEQNGELRVIAYASRVLNGAERNYSTTRKETTAAVYGLKQFRQYLLGRRFTLRTDHAALTKLLKTREVVGQQARYLDFLGQYTFDIVHRNGSRHQNSDSLSRRPGREELDEGISQATSFQEETITSKQNVRQDYDATVSCKNDIRRNDQEDNDSGKMFGPGIMPSSAENVGRIEAKNFIPEDESMVLDLENIRNEQSIDPDLNLIMIWKRASESSPPWSEVCGTSEDTRELWAQWESLTIIDGILYRRFEDVRKGTSCLQIILPRAVRDVFIRHCHRTQTGGHMGIRKTQEQVARRAYFCHWKRRVQELCQQCDECSRYSRGKLPRRGPMQIHEAGSPMDRIAIDLIGPHPRSSQGHVYILTAVDTFTRFLVAVPIRNKTAKTVATALYRFVFTKFGTSRDFVRSWSGV